MEAALRELVRRRAGNHCEYCRLPQSALPHAPFHVAHVVARQHGGSDDAANLALACDRCNLHKGPNLSGIDAETGVTVPLFHPRRNAWDDHFHFQGGRIFGRTTCGRATVQVLSMNATERVRLRAAVNAREQLR